VTDAIDVIEARRAARRDAADVAATAQRAIDLAALDALEETHGITNIARVDVPHTPGLPGMALARTPRPVEIKRYRDRVRARGDKPGDPVAAATELVGVALLYPDAETFAAMCEARPTLAVQLGVSAVGLATGVEIAAGKA